jgi:hypothetical protein
MRSAAWTFAGLVLHASVASACTLCHTPTGQQVRAGIFNESFGNNLLLTLAPFPVLAAVVLALHFGDRLRAGQRPPISTSSEEMESTQ